MYRIFDKWVICQAQLLSSSRLQPLRREDLLVFYLNGNWIPLQFKDVSWAFWETSDEHFSLNSWHFIDQRIKLLIWKVMNKSNLKNEYYIQPGLHEIQSPFVFITLSLSLYQSSTYIHVQLYLFILSWPLFSRFRSSSLMPRIDIKESPMMKPSAPVSPALASIHYVHSTLFEYQAPIASNTTLQTPFFLFFVSIIGRPDSTRGATGQRVQISWPQALGHFALYRPIGVCDLFWMLPWQLAYSAGVCSRWCFFCEHDLTFSFYVLFAIQTPVTEWAPSQRFPLNSTLLIAPAVIYTQMSLSEFNCSSQTFVCGWTTRQIEADWLHFYPVFFFSNFKDRFILSSDFARVSMFE